MKTSTLPALRVDAELRSAAESVLAPNETLSAFMTEAVRRAVYERRAQAVFIARGLAAEREAEESGVWYSAEEVLAGIDEIIATAQARRAARGEAA